KWYGPLGRMFGRKGFSSLRRRLSGRWESGNPAFGFPLFHGPLSVPVLFWLPPMARSRSRRGGKVGISRLWRDFQGSVGAGENLLLVFAGFHAPAFSTALRGRTPARQLFSRAAVSSHHVRTEPDRHGFIQMFVDGHQIGR